MGDYESDAYHPVIGFDGEAHDTLYSILRGMRGYGVTLTLDNGRQIEAVLRRPVYDHDSDRLFVEYYPVTDGEYPDIDDIPADQLVRSFVRRIQVS